MNCSFAARQYGQALPDRASPLLDLRRLSLAAMVKKVLDCGKAKPYRSRKRHSPVPQSPYAVASMIRMSRTFVPVGPVVMVSPIAMKNE